MGQLVKEFTKIPLGLKPVPFFFLLCPAYCVLEREKQLSHDSQSTVVALYISDLNECPWIQLETLCVSVSKYGDCVPLEPPHLSHSVLNILISGSFNGADQISLESNPPCTPPPPSTITQIMYLKCLLHNLLSINFCFKGCDTTSARCFSCLLLCSAWLCLDEYISLCGRFGWKETE